MYNCLWFRFCKAHSFVAEIEFCVVRTKEHISENPSSLHGCLHGSNPTQAERLKFKLWLETKQRNRAHYTEHEGYTFNTYSSPDRIKFFPPMLNSISGRELLKEHGNTNCMKDIIMTFYSSCMCTSTYVTR